MLHGSKTTITHNFFKHFLLRHPLVLFTLASLIGIFLLLVSLSITNPEYRKKYDPYDYAKVGESLWSGEGIALEGKPYALLPPGFPFIVGALNKIIGDPETAVKVTSIVFWVLNLFLFYVFLGYFFGEQLFRWIGILLYASNYPMLFSASAGRVEPVFLFFLLLFVVLLMKTSSTEKNPLRPFPFLCLSATLAAVLYYLRPEGLYLSLALFGIFLWRLSINRLKKIIYSIGFVGLVIILISPYLFFLRIHTGHFQLSGKTYANLVMGEMESPYQRGVYPRDQLPERYRIIERIIDDPKNARTFLDYLIESNFNVFDRIPYNLFQIGYLLFFGFSPIGLFFIIYGWMKMPDHLQIWLWGILSVWLIYLLFFIIHRIVSMYYPFLLISMIYGYQHFLMWIRTKFPLAISHALGFLLLGIVFFYQIRHIGQLAGG